MGDMGSKGASQKSSVQNWQVSQQGRGQVGVSGSTLNHSSITVYDADQANVDAANDVAAQALAAMAVGLNAAAVAGATAVNVAGKAVEENSGIAKGAIAASHANTQQALELVALSQGRALETVDRAVSAAQETALNATPIPPTTLEAQQAKHKRDMVLAGGIAAALITVVYATKN